MAGPEQWPDNFRCCAYIVVLSFIIVGIIIVSSTCTINRRTSGRGKCAGQVGTCSAAGRSNIPHPVGKLVVFPVLRVIPRRFHRLLSKMVIRQIARSWQWFWPGLGDGLAAARPWPCGARGCHPLLQFIVGSLLLLLLLTSIVGTRRSQPWLVLADGVPSHPSPP